MEILIALSFMGCSAAVLAVAQTVFLKNMFQMSCTIQPTVSYPASLSEPNS